MCPSDSTPSNLSIGMCSDAETSTSDAVSAATAAMVEKLFLNNGHAIYRTDSLKEHRHYKNNNRHQQQLHKQLVPLLQDHNHCQHQQLSSNDIEVEPLQGAMPSRHCCDSEIVSPEPQDRFSGVPRGLNSQVPSESQQKDRFSGLPRGLPSQSSLLLYACKHSTACGGGYSSLTQTGTDVASITPLRKLSSKRKNNVKIKLNDSENGTGPVSSPEDIGLTMNCTKSSNGHEKRVRYFNDRINVSPYRRRGSCDLDVGPTENPTIFHYESAPPSVESLNDCCTGTVTVLPARPVSEETTV